MSKEEIMRRKNLRIDIVGEPYIYLQNKRLLNNYRISFKNYLTQIDDAKVIKVERHQSDDPNFQTRLYISYIGPTTRASRRTFLDAGCKTQDKEGIRFNLAWGSPQKLFYYQSLSPGQIVNQIPGSNSLGRKDFLCKHIQQEVRRLKLLNLDSSFYENIIPKTFVMPQDIDNLIQFYIQNQNHFLIYKPAMAARGNGIMMLSQLSDIQRINPERPAIVQEYIEPLLYKGYKFDCRIYVLVTSINPLVVYINKEGLGRFSSHKYEKINKQNMNDMKMHLTNFAVNQDNGAIIQLENGLPSKWKLSELLTKIEEENNLRKGLLFDNIKKLVKATVIATENKYYQQNQTCQTLNVFPRRFYSLYGFDILFTDKFEAKLLEVNNSPATATGNQIDIDIKFELLSDTLHLVGPSCQYNEETKEIYIPKTKQFVISGDEENSENEYMQNNIIDQFDESQIGSGQLYSRSLEQLIDQINNNIKIDPKSLSFYEKLCIHQILDENTRIGNYERVYPTGEQQSQIYFTNMRYMNVLVNWLLEYQWKFVKIEQIKQVNEQTDSAIGQSSRRIQNVQCIAIHPIYKNIVAVATQYTIEIFNLGTLKNIYSFDIPQDIINEINQQQIIQQIIFIQPVQQNVECTFKENNSKLNCQIIKEKFQLAILIKNQSFIIILDLQTGQTSKIFFNEIILKLYEQNNPINYEIEFSQKHTYEDMFDDCIQKEKVPSQMFVAISQNSFYLVGLQYEYTNTQNQEQLIAQILEKRFQFLQQEYIDSIGHITFTDKPHTLILAKGKILYFYNINWIKGLTDDKSKKNEFQIEQRKYLKEILKRNGFQDIQLKEIQISEDIVRQTFKSLCDVSVQLQQGQIIQEVAMQQIYDLSNILDDDIQDIQYIKLGDKEQILSLLTEKSIYKFNYDSDQLQQQKYIRKQLQLKQQTMTLQYDLNEQEREQQENYYNQEQNQTDDDQSNDNDDIYALLSNSNSENQQYISQSEESITNESICSIEENTGDLTGYDYFIKNSYLKYNNQKIQLIKLLKDNQQTTNTFSQLYQFAKKDSETNTNQIKEINLSNYVQFFGQQPQFIDTNTFLLQINSLDDPILYSFNPNIEDKQVQLVMNERTQNIHFSKNVLKLIKLDNIGQFLIASRGDRLFIYYKQEYQ